MSQAKGWQQDSTGKRIYMEVRNQCDIHLDFEIVRVKATDNYFIYVKPKNQEPESNDVTVPPLWFEVVKIKESDF